MADLKGRVKNEPNGHQEILELLPWYLNGTLGADERARVQGHLQECATCRYEMDEMKGLQSAVLQEVPDLSEVLLQEALDTVRGRPATAEQPTARQAEKPVKERRFFLRPRLAFSFSMLMVIILAVGVYLGTLWSHAPGATGDLTNPNELGARIVNGYVVVGKQFLQQGTYTTLLGNQPIAKEDFTLEKDGNDVLRLSSTINSVERSGAGKTASQELSMSSDYRPSSYLITGNLVYQGNRAEAAISKDQAMMIHSGQDENLRRQVDLQGFPVLSDFSTMSQFELIHRVIVKQLDQGVAADQILLTDLAPQALRVGKMHLVSVDQAFLESPSGTVSTTRYRLKEESDDGTLLIELYATSKDELVAVYMPKQESLHTTAGLFAYRSDLYKDGLTEPTSTAPF
jgi:hypothetical protein